MTSREWNRVTRAEPCQVCGHGSWCMRKHDGSAAICARVESQQKVQRQGRDFCGYVHQLVEQPFVPARQRTFRVEPAKALKDWPRIAARYQSAIRPAELESHARGLGLSVESLRRLGLGIDRNAMAFSYPMSDATGRVVGIRLRAPNGSKFCVTGSTTGLFLPSGLEPIGSTLLICEGASDCAALLDLGFAAVGRPSCSGGVGLLCELARHHRPHEVVIVADVDAHGAGQRGAETLAQELLTIVPTVKVVEPIGVKDLRAWVQSGATRADVLALIDAAPARQLTVTFRLEYAT